MIRIEFKYELRNNFPRAAIKAIMQIKIIAARAENMIFARFVIPIISQIKREKQEARTATTGEQETHVSVIY